MMCVKIREKEQKKTDPSKEDIFNFIDNLPEDEREIVLTDGEPTMRNDLIDIIKYILKRNENTKIKIITNGRMFFYKNFADIISSFNNVSIVTEIHGHSEELHDKITRRSGSFRQTTQGIKNLLERGQEVELRILIHKMNYRSLEDIIDFVKENFAGLEKIVFFPIDYVGEARKNKESLYANLEDMAVYLEKAVYNLKDYFDIAIYHFPFCKLPETLWCFVQGKTVENSRLFFPKGCNSCSLYDFCPGFWKSYSAFIDPNIRPILKMKKTHLSLGYECNNNCVFCHVSSKKRMIKSLSTSQAKKEIQNIALKGLQEISFLGGEPTIRRDIIDLIRYAKSTGIKIITITTNGRMLSYPKFSRDLIQAGVDNIIFSIHGPNAEVHDMITRTPGSFKQLKRGIENVINKKIRLSFNITIVKGNYRYLPEIAKILIRYPFENVIFIFVHPFDEAEKNYQDVVPKLSEIEPYLHKAIDIGIQNNRDMYSKYVPYCYMQGYENHLSEVYENDVMEYKGPDFFEKDMYGLRKEKQLMKFNKCSICRYNSICFGTHKQHRNLEEQYRPVLLKSEDKT